MKKNKYSEYSDNLRKKLKNVIEKHKLPLYTVGLKTGVHRQIIKNFLSGKGLNYENGMALKTYVKFQMQKDNNEIL